MSHWRTFKTNVLSDVSMPTLERALQQMGLGIDHTVKQVKNSFGHSQVDAALTKQGRALSIGFAFDQENGKMSLTLHGDFWATGVNEQGFMDKLSQHYQRFHIEEKARQQGWSIESVTETAEGKQEMILAQWA